MMFQVIPGENLMVENAADSAAAPARRPTSALRDSLLLRQDAGAKSVFWTANRLPPPPPFYTAPPAHVGGRAGDGNSKALAVFWDLDSFDIAGEHAHCEHAVRAVRSFCAQFLGCSQLKQARDPLPIRGYCRDAADRRWRDTGCWFSKNKSADAQLAGAVSSPAESLVPEQNPAPGIPKNTGKRAGLRASDDNAGLRALAMGGLLHNLTVVDKSPFWGGADGECAQMATDLLVWMLDCVQRKLFVPTAIVISNDPAVAAVLEAIAHRGAYAVLLTSNTLRARVKDPMRVQVVLPFEQVVGSHMPLGAPQLRVMDHNASDSEMARQAAAAEARHEAADVSEQVRSTQEPPGADETQPWSSSAADPSRPNAHLSSPRGVAGEVARPATSPARSSASGDVKTRNEVRASDKRVAESARRRLATLEKAHAELVKSEEAGGGSSAPGGSRGEEEQGVGGSAEGVVQMEPMGCEQDPTKRTKMCRGSCSHPMGSNTTRPHQANQDVSVHQAHQDVSRTEVANPWQHDAGERLRRESPGSPRVPLLGDEMGVAAKMWCSWSKSASFGVGEAVCVKRSDGRYTLGVVIGLGTAGHYSSIHSCELTEREVEVLVDFDKKTALRVTRINRLETCGKFLPSFSQEKAESAGGSADSAPKSPRWRWIVGERRSPAWVQNGAASLLGEDASRSVTGLSARDALLPGAVGGPLLPVRPRTAAARTQRAKTSEKETAQRGVSFSEVAAGGCLVPRKITTARGAAGSESSVKVDEAASPETSNNKHGTNPAASPAEGAVVAPEGRNDAARVA